jgi:hypothetical protein
MPYSPDYSDYLKFKRQQSALTTDRQIAERKKRSVVPFSSYNPNYRILSYPPNIFTPSRLIPQENPNPPVTAAWIIDISDNTDLVGISPPEPVTKIMLNVTNGTTILIGMLIDFSKATGYTFDGTTATINPPSAATIVNNYPPLPSFYIGDTPSEDEFIITIDLTSPFTGPIDVLFNQ